MEKLPNLLRIQEVSSINYPHAVIMSPVEGCINVMEKPSASHSIIGMGKRGQRMMEVSPM